MTEDQIAAEKAVVIAAIVMRDAQDRLDAAKQRLDSATMEFLALMSKPFFSPPKSEAA